MTNNKVTTSKSGGIKPDEFPELVRSTKESARVSVSYGEGIEFGAIKVAATVTLNCDQTEVAIDYAGKLAFYKALELVQDGWSVINSLPEKSRT